MNLRLFPLYSLPRNTLTYLNLGANTLDLLLLQKLHDVPKSSINFQFLILTQILL